jgi:NAD+ synthase
MNLQDKISQWLNNYLVDSNLKTFVVGISGGIDSSLVSTLCCLTKQKTIVVSLPINQNYNQLDRARKHKDWLEKKFTNVSFIEIDLSNIFNQLKNTFENPKEISLVNTKSRLRMTYLYQIASDNNGIVVGTGNKVEDFGIGFFTKYGDGGVDISPIADLNKTEVRLLSKNLGILEEILLADPTDGLWGDDRTDESQIGATYEELEFIMDLYETQKMNSTILNDRQSHVKKIYDQLNKKNKHKFTPIPIFKK